MQNTINIFALIFYASFCASIFAQQDHHAKHPMPSLDSEGVYVISIGPTECVRLVPEFQACHENVIQVYDHQNPKQPIHFWNNLDDHKAGEWNSGRNATSHIRIIVVVARHKKTAKNAKKPWYLSKLAVLQQPINNGLKLGWDDSGGDGDYNDAQLSIFYISSEK